MYWLSYWSPYKKSLYTRVHGISILFKERYVTLLVNLQEFKPTRFRITHQPGSQRATELSSWELWWWWVNIAADSLTRPTREVPAAPPALPEGSATYCPGATTLLAVHTFRSVTKKHLQLTRLIGESPRIPALLICRIYKLFFHWKVRRFVNLFAF